MKKRFTKEQIIGFLHVCQFVHHDHLQKVGRRIAEHGGDLLRGCTGSFDKLSSRSGAVDSPASLLVEHVGMCAGTDELQVVLDNAVEQQPVRFNVRIA